MATYNWTYKNGVNNKYGISIASTANDSTRPTNVIYVAPFGNDVSGNGSRQLPYRTIAKAFAVTASNYYIILASGVYREAAPAGAVNQTIIGDGNVLVDITLVNSFFTTSNSFANIYNITFTGGTFTSQNAVNVGGFTDCVFKNMPVASNTLWIFNGTMRGCVLYNNTLRVGSQTVLKQFQNNTFYKCNILFLAAPLDFSIVDNIFYQCNVSFKSSPTYIDFCLFYQCNFRFNATDLTGATYYPSVPAGYTYYSLITDVQAANVTAFGTPIRNFNYCVIADPLFNNLAIYDFSLDPTSPAKNLSYFGSYIGAYSIANKLSVKATASLSFFDNASAVNLTIADDSLTLTSTASVGTIESKPIANLLGRQYNRLPVVGLNADRNGQYINTTLDLSASTLSAGAVPINTPYIVEIGSITYNGNTYAIGDRFTSATTSLSFTTSFSGVIREILQAPSRQAVEARFNDGTASTITNIGTIVNGRWYYVLSGSATYNGNTYATASFLKGVSGVTSFTGTAVLLPTFASSDPYFLFELNQAVTTNNTGNVITGSITKGNGSGDFDRTPANVFAVNLKFIQLKFTIQVANLTS